MKEATYLIKTACTATLGLALVLSLCCGLAGASKKHEQLKPRQNKEDGFDVLGKDTSEIIQTRGFIAENHYVQTQGGYKINVVRILNPAINGGTGGAPGKAPILMIHGVFLTASCFVMDSENIHPMDLSHLSIARMTPQQIKDLEVDPLSKSFPLMMSNFGHEVWLMNRRPAAETMKGSTVGGKADAPASTNLSIFGQVKKMWLDNVRKMVNFANFDPFTGKGHNTFMKVIDRALGKSLNDSLNPNAFHNSYWNFSLDEQADWDTPMVIDYVFEKSNNTKINVIGYSAGASVTLMMLSTNQRINDKCEYITSKIHMWIHTSHPSNIDAPSVQRSSVGASHGHGLHNRGELSDAHLHYLGPHLATLPWASGASLSLALLASFVQSHV